MSTSSATGESWMCPQCQGAVSMRADTCACGFVRKGVSAVIREAQVGQGQAEAHSLRGGFGLFVVGALCACLMALGLSVWYRGGTAAWQRHPQTPLVESQPQQEVGAQPFQPLVHTAPQATVPPIVSGEEIRIRSAPAASVPPEVVPQEVRIRTGPATNAPPSVAAQEVRIDVSQEATQPQEHGATRVGESPDPLKTEADWRQRQSQTRDRVRAAFNQCVRLFGVGGVSGHSDTQYADVRNALTSAILAQDHLERDARRAGVPSAWVRLDYSKYPRMTMPDPVACAGTPVCSVTVPHPCSLPDLRRSPGPIEHATPSKSDGADRE